MLLYFEPILILYLHGIVCTLLCLVIIIAVALLTKQRPNSEKNMAYECGFKPFDFAYYPFDVQFYRVGILFLLFDVEIMFFFPWALNFYQITATGHCALFLFIVLLLFGFLYELKSGALVWYPQPWRKQITYVS